jgi:hypothetical protein
MKTLNIYLPPRCHEQESYLQGSSSKTLIENEASRMLKNSDLPKRFSQEQEERFRKNARLLVRPKLYEVKFLRPYIRIDHQQQPTVETLQLRPKSKIFKTNFELNYARSIDLNSESTQFSDIDDCEPYELSDSELIEKSYLAFYEKTIDLIRSQKDQKLNLKRVSSIPLLSPSKEQACRRDLVKRVLKFKNVLGYNISSTPPLLSAKKDDGYRVESVLSAKSRYNTPKRSKSSSFEKRSASIGSKNIDSIAYLELIKDRKLNLINEKKSKYLDYLK